MGSLFRSELMSLVQLFVQSDAAYDVVGELGDLGICQFRDLNSDVSAFQRKFVNEVRRCDEMERKLRFFDAQLILAKLPITSEDDDDESALKMAHPSPREMDDLELRFAQLDKELREINQNEDMLKRNFLELTELSHILSSTASFFREADGHVFDQNDPRGSSEQSASLLRSDPEAASGSQVYGSQGVRVGFVAGAIPRKNLVSFERVLWRATRGNAFLRHTPIEGELEDPTTGVKVLKSVFLVFFQGDQLESRVRKISEGFAATVYPCPQSSSERRDLSQQVLARLQDLESVLQKTRDHRARVLSSVALQISTWIVQIKKIKAIFHTLNMFKIEISQKCLVAEAWVPDNDLARLRHALQVASARSNSVVPAIANVIPSRLKPPTYFRTNKFTEGFQTIVDAYGVASYREVNPAVFAIITFPFLFAVMFGDFGHAILMSLAGGFLCYYEDRLIKFKRTGGEIFNTFFGGRYIILLMGLFSIYTGLIYNDMFSRSLNIFGSGWNIPVVKHGDNTSDVFDLLPDQNFSHPYPFGMDPVWTLAENRLTFLNPYKMKMSVILGVSHMLFGITLGIFNHIHFKRYINIFCEFIPQVIFLTAIFGYLVFMIIFKWATFWPHSQAPSLLITLINMFLKFGSVEEKDQLYSGNQAGIQSFLVIVAFICVPWLLIPKPLIFVARANKKKTGSYLPMFVQRLMGRSRNFHLQIDDHARQGLLNDVSDDEGHSIQHAKPDGAVNEHQALGTGEEEVDDDEHHEIGEMVVHQSIHTIEFCLGCISNTASYLRLWALSLAHAELSEVLWEMILKTGLGGSNPIILFAAFSVWAFLTVAVLLIMEGLSAFLHALRLHWVEFNNKFYSGTGKKFKPFSFASVIEGVEEE